MIEIDGSKGGGQLLRTSLALSAITGKSFRMENIRGSRPNPGLKRQHLAAVETAARLSNAGVEGAEMESRELVFRPGEIEPEPFTANIGTAGSITLLLDSVIPVTTQFNGDFRLTVKGGTDVKWSPAFEYLRQVKMPLLERFGFSAQLELERTGFYPAGGGEAELETGTFSMEPLVLEERGELQGFEIFSKASEELEDQEVADRQADELERKLKNSHISAEVEKNAEYVETDSAGSSLVLKAVYENSVTGFDSLGERGKRSEKVAEEVYRDFRSFHSTDAAVDEHMADQLIVFLALAGGEVYIPEVTSHVQTSLETVRKFGFEVELDPGQLPVLFSPRKE